MDQSPPDPRAEQAERREALIERQRESLLEGEQISRDLQDEAPASRPSDEEINAKYERGEIRIVTEQGRQSLTSIKDILGSGDYKLDPDYQRRHRWTLERRSRLIESFIMNVPVPPVFFYEYEFGKFEVMDGLQRLTTLREFYSDEFALIGLEFWTELDGLSYSQLPSTIKAGIDRRYLSSIVLLKETSQGAATPELLKRLVFGRINTGGVGLSPQELRNALYDGPMNRLCQKLAKDARLRRLWGIPVDVEKLIDDAPRHADEPDIYDDKLLEPWRDMTDVELVLRFFANRQRMISQRGNIRDYLDRYLQAANEFSEPVRNELATLFLDTLELAELAFGENAFRRPLPKGNGWGVAPSKSIFDSLMNVLSRLLPHRDALIARSEEIQAGIRDLYLQNSGTFNLRGQNRNDLNDRELLLETFLRGFIPAA